MWKRPDSSSSLSLLIFAAFLALHSSSALARLTNEELANVQVSVTPILIDRTDESQPASLVCLTKEWEAVDPSLHAEILDLKSAAPEAFASATGENPNLCFDPVKIPESSRDALVKILNRISELSGEKIAIPVEFARNFRDVKPTYSQKYGHAFPQVGEKVSPLDIEPLERPDDRFRNEDRSMGKKLVRSSAIIQGTQAFGMGVLLVLPSSITKWSESPLKSAGRNIKRAWTTPPVWDKDDWAINYIGHPYSGALYYNALRSQGASPLASFLFSTAQSFFWEYTVEATAEQPSIQDMLFTSTIGSVYGELAHRATIGMSRSGNRFSALEKITVVIINPTYVINNGFKKKHARPKPVF